MHLGKQEKYKLQTMESAYLDVLFSGIIKALAKIFKTTKKDLRKAWKIINTAELEDEIMIKKRLVRKKFSYGFRSFILQEKRKPRKILAPHPKVQKVFKTIGKTAIGLQSAHPKAFGFVKKRNILGATQTLLGNKHYFSFDITEAFPSITAEILKRSLEKTEIHKTLIEPLVWLVTYHYIEKRRLPQGASSSPALLNLVYKPMCNEIDMVCQVHGISWFVYADDFNFASKKMIPPEVKEKLLAIPGKFGFSVKKEKTKDNLAKTIPHMLGLTIVGQKIHIQRQTKKRFRKIFYLAWKHNAYPEEVVAGVAANIRQTYGSEKKWPGWLSKYWILYQKKGKEAKNEK